WPRPPYGAALGDHPSGPAVADRLKRPTRRHRTGRPQTPAQEPQRLPSGLAPGGVYRAAPVTRGAGGLLHHPFTLTRPRWPGGLLSVALSRGSPRVAVSNHPALWSPDCPRPKTSRRCPRPRPPFQLVHLNQDTPETPGSSRRRHRLGRPGTEVVHRWSGPCCRTRTRPLVFPPRFSAQVGRVVDQADGGVRSEEHTSELQ